MHSCACYKLTFMENKGGKIGKNYKEEYTHTHMHGKGRLPCPYRTCTMYSTLYNCIVHTNVHMYVYILILGLVPVRAE